MAKRSKVEELASEALEIIGSKNEALQPKNTTQNSKEAVLESASWMNDIFSADELEAAEIPPTQWIVSDLLPVGLNIIASPPKFGKSWMVLDLCECAVQGLPFMGWNTTKCDVLYLALEDNKGRLKERQKILLGGGKSPSNCKFLLQTPAMGELFAEEMEKFLKAYPKTRLIVIDTFSKIRGERGHSESEYQYDYREAGALKRFADSHNLAIVIVHHLRKMVDSSDPFNRISGSTGLFGVVDTAIVMTKEHRSDKKALFTATGRDIEDIECYIEQDEANKQWHRIGTKEEITEKENTDKYKNSVAVTAIRKLASPDWWTGNAKKLLSDYLAVVGPNVPQHPLSVKELSPWLSELRSRDGIEVVTGVCKEIGKGKTVDGATRISFRKVA